MKNDGIFFNCFWKYNLKLKLLNYSWIKTYFLNITLFSLFLQYFHFFTLKIFHCSNFVVTRPISESIYGCIIQSLVFFNFYTFIRVLEKIGQSIPLWRENKKDVLSYTHSLIIKNCIYLNVVFFTAKHGMNVIFVILAHQGKKLKIS